MMGVKKRDIKGCRHYLVKKADEKVMLPLDLYPFIIYKLVQLPIKG
jgi:hypothetical protein